MRRSSGSSPHCSGWTSRPRTGAAASPLPTGLFDAQLEKDAPALARMGLDKPQGLRERLLRRAVALGLRRC